MKTYFRWTDHAKADLRRVDRQHAVEILRSLTDYASTGVGDVKCLKGSRDFDSVSATTAFASKFLRRTLSAFSGKASQRRVSIKLY